MLRDRRAALIADLKSGRGDGAIPRHLSPARPGRRRAGTGRDGQRGGVSRREALGEEGTGGKSGSLMGYAGSEHRWGESGL